MPVSQSARRTRPAICSTTQPRPRSKPTFRSFSYAAAAAAAAADDTMAAVPRGFAALGDCLCAVRRVLPLILNKFNFFLDFRKSFAIVKASQDYYILWSFCGVEPENNPVFFG